MISLKDYALEKLCINENRFRPDYFFHNNYGKMILNDLLSGKSIILGDKGDGYNGYDSLDINDFKKETLEYLLDHYGEGTPEDAKNMFNDACKKINNCWSHIWKSPYSGKNRKLNGGLAFEDELCSILQELIINDGQSQTKSNYKQVALKLYNKIKDTDTIKLLSKKSNDEISNFVFVSGKGSTARNKYNQIINKDTYEVNISKKRVPTENSIDEIENILTQSGKIIADITITTNNDFNKSDINHVDKNDIYISCKDGDAQLTGICMQEPFYGSDKKTNANSYLIQCYKQNKTYEEFKSKPNELCVRSFECLCKLLSVDEKIIYDYFSKPIKERKKFEKIKVNKKPEKDEIISILIQLIVGGNYYYVNSGNYSLKSNKVDGGEVVWIDDNIDENKFEFVPTGNGYLYPSLIAVEGYIKTKNGAVKSTLKFRSSSGDDYPFRLFIVIDDKHIMRHLYEKEA